MQQMGPEERREFQRLTVNPPISAKLGKQVVSILEIGVLGARVRHNEDPASEHLDLRFSHGGQQIEMKCEVLIGDPEFNCVRIAPVRKQAAVLARRLHR